MTAADTRAAVVRGRRVLAGLSAAALAAVTAGGCTGGGPPGSRTNAALHPAVPRHASGGPAAFPGPDGVEAQWVIDENKLPGTTAWEIRGSAGGISGFASKVYADEGQKVTLYVTTTGPWFRAEAFRIGYYQGKGGRLIWASGKVDGKRQPACPLTPGINMVSCDNWSPSLTFTVTSAWVQGDYMIKLAGPGNRQSYVPLSIWDPDSTATYVVKNDVFTWQAWNYYGGYDYYTGEGSCPAGVYPLCSRARVVSFDRPYATEDGAGSFFELEYPLVRFMESRGLDVTYASDLTLQEHPDFLLRHKVLLSLGHDEAWSLGERQDAVRAQEAGVNIVFFGASPILRHVRTQASPLGPDRELADYRDSAADPLDGHGNPLQVTGNEWGSPLANWPEYDFVGDTYDGYLDSGDSTGFRVADASSWVFQGTGLHDGSLIPGVVAMDVDKFDAAYGQPADDQILGHTPIPADGGYTSLGAFYSDMTYYTDPASGAGVLDTGTNNWIPALSFDSDGCGVAGGICGSAEVQRITGNILRAFGAGPAGRAHPSVANWRQVSDAG
jgi:hypothetical protein